jgi:hypothetical protein
LKTLAWLLVLTGGVAACDKTLVPGTAYDQPLFSFRAGVRPRGGLSNAAHPRIGLLWIDPLQRQPDLPGPAHWIESSAPIDDAFSVDVFRPPPPQALVDIPAPTPSADVTTIALAEIVLIDDHDQDGTFRVSGPRGEIAGDDRYLAGCDILLAYVARPYAQLQPNFPIVPTPTSGTGYELVSYSCAGPLATQVQLFPPSTISLTLQPSRFFPDVRTCRRSHSP